VVTLVDSVVQVKKAFIEGALSTNCIATFLVDEWFDISEIEVTDWIF
jgi:hypothetical protein